MKNVKQFEIVFAIIGLMFFAGALNLPLAYFIARPSISIVRYIVFAGSLVLLFQRWRSSLRTLLRGGWILGFILLLSASFVWAQSPRLVFTGIRGEVLPMTCFSLYLGARFSLREQFKSVTWALGLSMLLSIFFVFALPTLGTHVGDIHTGAWKGAFDHKNTFSVYAVMTTTIFFLSAIYAQKNHLLRWGLFGACIGAILLSESVTGLVLSTTAILFILIYRRIRWVGKRSVLILIMTIFMVGMLISVLIAEWDPIMYALGKDPTLSARTLIWGFLIEHKIPANPWFGYGRGMFWKSIALYGGIEVAAHHTPAHAHNGFIDLVLDIGLIGTFFFAMAFSVTFAKALRVYYLNRGEAAYQWPSILLTLMLLNNYTESYITRLANLFWVIFVSLAFTLNREKPANL